MLGPVQDKHFTIGDFFATDLRLCTVKDFNLMKTAVLYFFFAMAQE
jgi:hypothetical protein